MKQPDAAKQSSAAAAVVNAPPSDYAPYPKIDPTDVAPVTEETWTTVPMAAPSPPPLPEHPTVKSPEHAPKQNSAPLGPGSASEAPEAVAARDSATTMPPMDSNPYVSPSPVPAPASSAKKTMESVKDVLGKLGKRTSEAAKKVEVYAGDMWQHLRTGPSFADAAVGRIAQGTKVLAEGGYEKIFRQTFVVVPEEQLLKTYACYLSTSAGPVMGVLYLSSAKLAFCSDNPLSYKVGEETQWSHYKVAIPLHQLKAVNPSTSKVNPSEKFIQVVSVDDHEFWFMGFVNYESAVKNLQGAFQPHCP